MIHYSINTSPLCGALEKPRILSGSWSDVDCEKCLNTEIESERAEYEKLPDLKYQDKYNIDILSQEEIRRVNKWMIWFNYKRELDSGSNQS